MTRCCINDFGADPQALPQDIYERMYGDERPAMRPCERYEELFMREKEARRLRGNLSCQDVSFLPVTNPRTFHGSYSSLQKTLARCEETGGAPRTQSNRDSQYLCKVGHHLSHSYFGSRKKISLDYFSESGRQ